MVCTTEINDKTGLETEQCNCEVDTNECQIGEEKICIAEQAEDGSETESCECKKIEKEKQTKKNNKSESQENKKSI